MVSKFVGCALGLRSVKYLLKGVCEGKEFAIKQQVRSITGSVAQEVLWNIILQQLSISSPVQGHLRQQVVEEAHHSCLPL